jgi:glycosyltransferase involved in cell wall biosynthesis
MKLIIQIPCFNEEKTLPSTIADLPGNIEGIDIIETQVIDDGSTDDTLKVAESLKVNHIISFKTNRGLAEAFKAGVDNAIINGAEILVNTDGDNQYCGEDIVKLVRPIVNGKADIVIGCRPIDTHPEFSIFKKIMQKIGSCALRKISNTSVKDAASGFRAYNKSALLRMNIYSQFSYCMETLIQAGFNNLKIVCVDIKVNLKTRDSRLFKNILEYIWKQSKTMVTIFLLYRANWIFNFITISVLLLSFFFVVRYIMLISFFNAPAASFWPSIILSGVLFIVAVLIFFVGILASLISSVRKLCEDINYRIKKLEIDRKE